MTARAPTICIDCRYIGPRPSGIGSVVEALADHLPALAPHWRFRFLRNPALGRRLSNAPNVTEVDCAASPNGPASMWWLPRLVDLGGVDLFHAPSNTLPRGLPFPAVTTIHDVMWLTRPDLCNASFWGQIERQFYRHGIRRALRRSDAVLTVSHATARDIADLPGPPAPPVHVVHPGIDRRFRRRAVAPADRARLGMPERRFVLTVGQLAPYKNHEGALRGFAAAFADRPDIDFVLVQRRGPDARHLLELATALGMAGRLHFVRPESVDEMASWYSAADALLHPSLCEGFGMPLAEAMACGCPIVTSNRSAMPEVVGEAGLLADPSDPASLAAALLRILDDPQCGRGLSQAGQRRAQAFDRRAFAAGNLAIYREVLGCD